MDTRSTRLGNFSVHITQTTRFDSLEQLLAHSSIKNTTIVMMEQVHSGTVTVLDSPATQTVLQTDAVITQQPNTTIIVKTADCLPILIAHPSGAIAAIHAGRKGTQSQILKKTLLLLQEKFGIEDSLNIWFGPHICESCYQVDRPTNTHYSLLNENKTQLEEVFSPNTYKLEMSPDCTLCKSEMYYSYRRDAPLMGRLNYSAVTLAMF